MNFPNVIIKTLKKIKEIISFVLYKAQRNTSAGGDKIVYINLKKPNLYSRYLYLFLKFLNIEGFKIIFPNNLQSFKKIFNADIYLKLLLKEHIIEFDTKKKLNALEINDELLSPEYFSLLIDEDQKDYFHIPMSFHPLFYHNEQWQTKITNDNRKKSVFMIGNFENDTYSSLDFSLFKVYSRTEIFIYLKKSNDLFLVNSSKEFHEFLFSNLDNKCLLIDRNNFSIKLDKLRATLSEFYFFLSCPGVVIPQSHNLIEALSCGCIPIIQKEYAALLHPPLLHMKNAILYKDLEDLRDKLQIAYSLDLKQIKKMQQEIYEYYEIHLTPTAIIKKLFEKKYSKIFLQAEFESVRHLKLQKAYKNAGKIKPKFY